MPSEVRVERTHSQIRNDMAWITHLSLFLILLGALYYRGWCVPGRGLLYPSTRTLGGSTAVKVECTRVVVPSRYFL